MPALHEIRLLQRHVVAKVVKTKFVVRAIGDVRLVLKTAFFRGLPRHNAPGGHTQCPEYTAHEVRLVGGEVIVHRDNVNTSGRNSVQIRGQGGHQRFTLTSLHLRDVAEVQGSTTHQLDVKVSKAQRALRCFTHSRKSLGK